MRSAGGFVFFLPLLLLHQDVSLLHANEDGENAPSWCARLTLLPGGPGGPASPDGPGGP